MPHVPHLAALSQQKRPRKGDVQSLSGGLHLDYPFLDSFVVIQGVCAGPILEPFYSVVVALEQCAEGRRIVTSPPIRIVTETLKVRLAVIASVPRL